MSAATPDDLARLRDALAETLAAIEGVRQAIELGDASALALPGAVRSERPAESIPMLEQEAADLRRDIRAMEAELAR
ncbi:MAG TPA: hypothetical protein VGF46_09740 [Gaiellales bacterium]